MFSKVFAKAQLEGRKLLLEPESKTICADYDIPVARGSVAASAEEAARIADKMGYPVVLKIVSPDISHKSDVGGVRVKLGNANEVSKAYEEILNNVIEKTKDARIVGVLVQEMVPSSTEVIVGAIKDAQFGQTLMFGLGGVFVEILKDVAFRIAPLTENDAYDMITEIKAYPLLMGYRNIRPVDISAIVSILMNTSRLVMEHQEIMELDLNPIMVYERGAKAVDARIILV